VYASNIITNVTWNSSLTSGTNIMGRQWIGGNYWTNSTGNGYSDTCDDYVSPWGICDDYYNISTSMNNPIDWLPLSDFTNVAPTITLHSPPNASSTTDNSVILNATVEDQNNQSVDTNIYAYYADEIDASLETGLVALYHFNNDSSVGENDTLVYDWSGNGYNGTAVGDPSVTSDCKLDSIFIVIRGTVKDLVACSGKCEPTI